MKSKRQFRERVGFLDTLYKILDNEEQKSAFWDEDGFMIKNVQQFETEILPKYFKHGHYSSFVRSLNKHGFKIKSTESGITQFSHQTININKREGKKQKQEKKFEHALNFEVEILVMQQQIIEMRNQQRILQKEMEISLKMMEFLTKTFNRFSEVNMDIILDFNLNGELCPQIQSNLFREWKKNIFKCKRRIIICNYEFTIVKHKIAISKVAFPEFYDSAFITPNQSILSTPLPYFKFK